MPPARVLLVDDQALFREGIAQLLSTQPDLEVVGEASDGVQAIEMVRDLRPDLVLMDIQMPRMSGLEATVRIKEEFPDTHVVMLTVSDADDDLFEAIKNGASGYLPKNIKAVRFFEQLRGVLRGEAALTPYLASRILQEFARQRQREEVMTGYPGGLTEREKEVLQFVVEGYSNKEIGGFLSIAESTVKRHLHNILEKLQMENRVQAAAYAVRTGLVSPPDSSHDHAPGHQTGEV